MPQGFIVEMGRAPWEGVDTQLSAWVWRPSSAHQSASTRKKGHKSGIPDQGAETAGASARKPSNLGHALIVASSLVHEPDHLIPKHLGGPAEMEDF